MNHLQSYKNGPFTAKSVPNRKTVWVRYKARGGGRFTEEEEKMRTSRPFSSGPLETLTESA